jgi:hypothetical protein
MLTLDSSQLIGRGLRRECYFHPEDDTRCIKVVVAGDHKETVREQSYYRLLEKRGISWDMLARFYGNMETNRGPGAIFELIRDYTGAVSNTLEYYFSNAHESELDYRLLTRLLPVLKQYLLQWKIVTMSIRPQNIVYKRINPAEAKLVIIDNIGNSDFIPICNYVGRMAIRKINRKWRRFEITLRQEYPQNRSIMQMLKEMNG